MRHVAESAKNLYVASDPVSGTGSVTVYVPGTSTPLRTITDGIANPDWLAFDSAENLYVSNRASPLNSLAFPSAKRRSVPALRPYSLPTVTVYAPGATTASRTITAGIKVPQQIAIDSSGNVYVANGAEPSTKGNVVVIKAGKNEVLKKIVKGMYNPFRLAIDSSGGLYVANEGSGSVGPGWVSVYSSGKKKKLLRMITNGIDFPVSLALDSSGNLYVGNYQADTVTVYAPGSSSPLRTISNGVLFAFALAFDSSGNLYVANYDTVTVYAAGTSTLILTIPEATTPYSLAFGSNGYLNVANLAGGSANGSITEYPPDSDRLARTITDGIDNPAAIGFGP
jgi:sugar lactone lactonase YvrE